MKNIKKLILRSGLILLIGTCSYSLQKDSKSVNAKPIGIFTEDTIPNKKANISYDSHEVYLISTPSSSLPEKSEIEDERLLVALTFDDGPSAYTEDLLELLAEYDVKATFFVIGDNCKKYPTTLSLINDYGHEIAIHGETHTSFTKLSISKVEKEIESTINYIEDLGIDAIELVRPPYGSLNSKLKKRIEYPFIFWNIDTRDWETKNKKKIKKEITDNIEEGSIILMHDTKAVHKADLEALEELLPKLTKEYKFVTVSELAESFDIELENGKTYRKIKSEY